MKYKTDCVRLLFHPHFFSGRNRSGILRFSQISLTVVISSLTAYAADSGISYHADFEAPSFTPGNIDGQSGWSVQQGKAVIRPGSGRNASAGLVLEASTPFSQAALLLEASVNAQSPVFLDLFVSPAATDGILREEMLDMNGARIGFFRSADHPEEGRFHVFSGDGSGGGMWVPTEITLPVDKLSGRAKEWIRLTMREDTGNHSWDFWIDEKLAADGVLFEGPRGEDTRGYVIMGDAVEYLALDDLTVGITNPLGADEDADGMLDGEENRIGSNPSLSDRAGLDTAGVPFREKWWSLLTGGAPPLAGSPLSPVVFSEPSSVVHGEFPLTLSAAGATTVYYTTNGSIPRPGEAQIYTGPIPITETTVIRACAADDEGRFSGIAAAAWIFPEDVPLQRRPGEWPETLAEKNAGGTESLYELNPLMLTGASPLPSVDEVASALEKAPIVVLSMDPGALFGANGVFDAAPSPSLKGQAEVVWMDAGSGRFGGAAQATVTLSGQSSRRHAVTLKHSLRVTLPSVTGAATVFGGDTFPSDQFLLRQPTQDSWAVSGNFSGRREIARYVTDAWSSQWLRDQGHVSPEHRWVHVFLNNIYWGVYEAVEQHDSAYAMRHPAAGTSRNLVEPAETGSARAILGSAAGWVETLGRLRQLSSQGESAADSEWEQGAADVDVAGLTDYMLWNWWMANEDWPSRNWIASLEGGKWRFLSWDAEMALPAEATKRTGMAARLATDNTGPAAAFTALSRWKGFREAVLARFESLAADGGALSEGFLINSLGNQAEAFSPLVAAESARWGAVYAPPFLTASDWRARMEWVSKNYIPGRTAELRGELTGWLTARAAEARRVKEPEPEPAAVVPETPADEVDSDGDGIPDVWERRFGLDPSNPEDALLDLDGDGLLNFEEFARGTDPSKREQFPQLDETSPGLHTKFQERKPRAQAAPSTPEKETPQDPPASVEPR